MANLDNESLFSLELIVDQLRLRQSVVCRIPAVAFRLLDFPTLLIYHTEPDLARMIRSKLLADRHRPVPAQLKELKDRKTDAFTICRGKSCLFRVSANALVTSLSSAPLYVMVVDMFPETPKLVGSCGVPLNTCAHDLYTDIISHGVSVPAVRAEKHELDLYNLMGEKLGTILLGYRLLSLGAALLSHIPSSNIIHVKPKEMLDSNNFPTMEASHIASEAYNDAVQQVTSDETRLRSSEIDVLPHSLFVDSHTQVEPTGFGTVATQTSRHRSHKEATAALTVGHTDDCITTNMVCPPPLFYNNATCKRTVYWQQEEWSSVWQKASDNSSWSDDGTIRVEDKYLDADETTSHDMQSFPRTVQDKQSLPTMSKNRVTSDPVLNKTPHSDSMSQFPILSALMAEILRFGGMNLVADDSRVATDGAARYKVHHIPKLKKHDTVNAVEPKRTVHRCANMIQHDLQQKIPKQKSHVAPAPHKPLSAGMTNTQRLRLAKTNPKLLEELNAREQQRKYEFKMAHLRTRQKENCQKTVNKVEPLNFLDSLMHGNESRESTAQFKRPVPTPRTSKILLAAGQIAEKNVAAAEASDFGIKTYTVDHTRVEVPFSLQSSSEEKIELTVPALVDDSDSDYMHRQSTVNHTDLDLKLAGKPLATYPQLHTVDGPNNQPDDVFRQRQPVLAPVMLRETSPENNQQETAGGGNIISVEDLGLQKIVDHYSGDSDDNSHGTELVNADKELESRYDSAENGHDQDLSENSGKDESEHQNETVNQYSEDVSESEQYKVEYEDDYDDTPARSMKTISTMNSSGSSMVGAVVHKKTISPSQDAVPKLQMFNQSQTPNRRGETGRGGGDQATLLTDRSLGAETYSDAFEMVSDDEIPEAKPVREAKLLPSAQLGYTWT